MQIQSYLQQARVPFEVLVHEPTFDAQHLAQAVHVSGCDVAKTVLLRGVDDLEDVFVLVVLPAPQRVDFDRVAIVLELSQLKMASERDLAELCPDCEVGALPPFGSQLGIRTVVDEALTHDETIVFEGNAHTEAIKMKYRDFERLESPRVAKITE